MSNYIERPLRLVLLDDKHRHSIIEDIQVGFCYILNSDNGNKIIMKVYQTEVIQADDLLSKDIRKNQQSSLGQSQFYIRHFY